jgi:hypothetical protein
VCIARIVGLIEPLVGLPGFEPGTSCTPSIAQVSISFMRSLVSNRLDEFGDLASAPSKSLGNGSIHGLFTVTGRCRILAAATVLPRRDAALPDAAYKLRSRQIFLTQFLALRSRKVELQMMDRQRFPEIRIIELNRNRGRRIDLERLK